MWLKKYLSSLKSTYYFMILFGLIMGAVFPFYSYFFFGKGGSRLEPPIQLLPVISVCYIALRNRAR